MFKRISFFALVIILILCGYAAMQPDYFKVERSTIINAPAEKIFPLMNDLQQFTRWSPYEGRDPAMKRTFSTNTVGKGASYAWDGNNEVGSGRMEITESIAPQKISIRLDFSRPMEAHNAVSFALVPSGSATQVTWAMEGPMPFLSKLMCIFFDKDAMVGKDFEDGRQMLKQLVEQQAPSP